MEGGWRGGGGRRRRRRRRRSREETYKREGSLQPPARRVSGRWSSSSPSSKAEMSWSRHRLRSSRRRWLLVEGGQHRALCAFDGSQSTSSECLRPCSTTLLQPPWTRGTLTRRGLSTWLAKFLWTTTQRWRTLSSRSKFQSRCGCILVSAVKMFLMVASWLRSRALACLC